MNSRDSNVVKVSSKYQIVIPRSVRESAGIKPGQEVSVLLYRGHLHIIPIRPIEELRGIAKGMDVAFEREPDREL